MCEPSGGDGPPNDGSSPPSVSSAQSETPLRDAASSKITCTNCRKSHVTCDGKTPCHRCSLRAIECIAAPRRKPGPQPKRMRFSDIEVTAATTLISLPPINHLSGGVDVVVGEAMRKLLPPSPDEIERSDRDPPALYVPSEQELEEFEKIFLTNGHSQEGFAAVRRTALIVRNKMNEIKKFVTVDQREYLWVHFKEQLQAHKEMAQISDTPTLIWERCNALHFINKAAIQLLGWVRPMPYRENSDLLHVLSPQMSDFLRVFLIKSFLDGAMTADSYRAGYRRVENQKPEYKMCNFIVSVKRDLLGLPQLFVMQMVPDPEPRVVDYPKDLVDM
ncbi:hypothetical protein PROFUN_04636 [Planoprotostelium fungivorum]|uniref:Zn(2)-C6 fungal-type domain-containing protein n=1 Tax=Planoprotostelium fungivorum TaxID=1890364 RepID=A0A2P6NUG4_9EUKA|nr:hypothetical protein PROFUN_04636 [Planoprotostelium fungivorum]